MGRYGSTGDLPEGVKNNLPAHAQEIYKSSFNKAIEDKKNNDGDQSQEQYAHRVAWSAVKQKYEKGDKNWHRKESS